VIHVPFSEGVGGERSGDQERGQGVRAFARARRRRSLPVARREGEDSMNQRKRAAAQITVQGARCPESRDRLTGR
jgi:hypothetical protein